MYREHITAKGHHNISARHRSTLEVTTDDWLTPTGDCIVGIGADRAPVDFSAPFVAACQDAGATITLTLSIDDHAHRLVGRGDPALTFRSDRSLVCRTSTYVDDRTVLLEAEGAARDVDRTVIAQLATGSRIDVTLQVTPGSTGESHGDDRSNHRNAAQTNRQ